MLEEKLVILEIKSTSSFHQIVHEIAYSNAPLIYNEIFTLSNFSTHFALLISNHGDGESSGSAPMSLMSAMATPQFPLILRISNYEHVRFSYHECIVLYCVYLTEIHRAVLFIVSVVMQSILSNI